MAFDTIGINIIHAHVSQNIDVVRQLGRRGEDRPIAKSAFFQLFHSETCPSSKREIQFVRASFSPSLTVTGRVSLALCPMGNGL